MHAGNRRWALALLLVAASAVAGGRQEAVLERLRRHAVVETDLMVAMRDGVRLATDVARPKGGGPRPTVLVRTPYRKRLAMAAPFVQAGYAFVVQDVRGRYGSEGVFYPFVHERDDGEDTIAWVAGQPWCDGNVGMVGGSYLGFTQLAAATGGPPALRCILPVVPPSDFDHGTLFFGGALRQELAQGWLLGQSWVSQRVRRGQVPAEELRRWQPHRRFHKWCWHLPLAEPGPIAVGGPGYARCWRDMVAGWERPDAWRAMSPAAHPEAIRVPTLVVAGFYDIFAQENIDLLLALRARGGSEASRTHSHLLIGPWVHGVGRAAGDVDFPAARAALAEARRKWLPRWLAGERSDVDRWPPIRAFVMGQDRWLEADAWPPSGTKPVRFYLADSGLSRRAPAAGIEPSTFVYDPAQPVPTLGGGNLLLPKGVHDHRRNAGRPDVLTFLGEPLEADLVVVGPLRACLHVSSSAPDTDFTAMLLDVRPDGYMANVQDGIARLRYREGRDAPRLLQPGEIVKVAIHLWSTAYAFKKGHRVGLLVSSSNFPRFDRHLNVAREPWRWAEPRKATNRVHHDASHRSYLELPVLAGPAP
ncbi:MAG: CocE/NonD family hydrolase [bacterium]